jgi:hypothetical protein
MMIHSESPSTNGLSRIKARILWVVGLLAALALILVAILWFFDDRIGTKVRIENTGSDAIVGVVLHVSGRSYEVGSIPSGKVIMVRVFAKYDSQLEIELDSSGSRQRIELGGYFDSGISAKYDIKMNSEGVQSCQFDYP